LTLFGHLEELVLGVVLDEVGVDPALAVAQAILRDVRRNLQSLGPML
jgi:hypothetical protein